MDFPGHFEHIFQQLNHQRLHAQLCDCVVLVGNQSFQSHRSILAACSSHFRALLSSTEVNEGGGPGTDGTAVGVPSVIKLDPGVVTPEAFSTLLDMIYTSTLTVGTSNVMDVLLAASHLHLNTVVKACKLYLSKCNFPTSPPKGWRSAVQQHQPSPSSQAAIGVSKSTQQGPVLLQHVGLSLATFEPDVESNERQVGMEVSQSGGDENGGVGLGSDSGEHRHKRKSPLNEERCGSRLKNCRLSPQSYGDGSSITTWSISNDGGGGEGEELPSPDSLKTDEGLLLGRTAGVGEEDVEEKYEATKGESEEKQLTSQSDSGVPRMQRDGGVDGEAVVKVKVGEEEEEKIVEVKMENLSSSSSPDLVPVPDVVANPAEYCNDQLDEFGCCEKLSPYPTEGGSSPSEPQPCAVPQTETQMDGRNTGEESIDSEGLASLSDLALSCFLNTSSENAMGANDDESLVSLTTTATVSNSITSAAQAVLGDSGESPQNAEATNACSPPTSCSASSLVFPVTSVPFQQLLPTQAHNFSDTLILQPNQTSLGGILRPGLSLQPPLIQPSSAGKSRGRGGLGAPAFRRIAPKVIPGSEAFIDPQSPSSSSGCAGEAVNHTALTRASEDVLSKCKKAASSDHVLLVEGEKKYACRICCKTFMNLTDCKKHIRVHTGEKPYPCPKCGKRFSQSSHLYKHCNNTCLNWKSGTQLIPSSSEPL